MTALALAVKTSPPAFEKASVAPVATVTVPVALKVSAFSVMLVGTVIVADVLIVAVSLAVCGMPADQFPALVQMPDEAPIHVESSARRGVETSNTTVALRETKYDNALFMTITFQFYWWIPMHEINTLPLIHLRPKLLYNALIYLRMCEKMSTTKIGIYLVFLR
jgi:hypothetical protein